MTAFASPDQMLADVIEHTGTITKQLKAITTQISAIRPRLRDLFNDQIHPVPVGPAQHVTAIDGACVTDQLAVGDHSTVLAVSVTQDADGQVGITGHRSWGGLLSHSADQDTLVKSIMLTTEASLVPDAGDGLVILDGSRTTALHAIHAALSSYDEEVARLAYRYCRKLDVTHAFTMIAAGDHVVGSAKSNSSRSLWKTATEHGLVTGYGVPDKVLCGMILDPGEMLISPPEGKPDRSWIDGELIGDPEHRGYFRELAQGFSNSRSTPWVAHAKPHQSVSVFRIELSPTQDQKQVIRLIQTVCQNGTPPYIQEPVTQYVADIIAKKVSTVSKVQMERSQMEAAEESDGLLEYLVRSYRTN